MITSPSPSEPMRWTTPVHVLHDTTYKNDEKNSTQHDTMMVQQQQQQRQKQQQACWWQQQQQSSSSSLEEEIARTMVLTLPNLHTTTTRKESQPKSTQRKKRTMAMTPAMTPAKSLSTILSRGVNPSNPLPSTTSYTTPSCSYPCSYITTALTTSTYNPSQQQQQQQQQQQYPYHQYPCYPSYPPHKRSVSPTSPLDTTTFQSSITAANKYTPTGTTHQHLVASYPRPNDAAVMTPNVTQNHRSISPSSSLYSVDGGATTITTNSTNPTVEEDTVSASSSNGLRHSLKWKQHQQNPYDRSPLIGKSIVSSSSNEVLSRDNINSPTTLSTLSPSPISVVKSIVTPNWTKSSIPLSTISTTPISNRKNEEKWMTMYSQLQQYKAKHGDCMVPRGYVEIPGLANWVCEQRKQYKLRETGKRNSLSDQRITLLNIIEFEWNAPAASWNRHIAALLEYKKEFGHVNVPVVANPENSNLDPKQIEKYASLGQWVKEQRRFYYLQKNEGMKTSLTAERIDQLESLGFCWSTQESIWYERFYEFLEYIREHGHAAVPTNYPTNPNLGSWVHYQRREYQKIMKGQKGYITDERVQLLNDAGFIWYPKQHNNITTLGNGGASTTASTTLSTKEPIDTVRPSKPKMLKRRAVSLDTSTNNNTISSNAVSSTSLEQQIRCPDIDETYRYQENKTNAFPSTTPTGKATTARNNKRRKTL